MPSTGPAAIELQQRRSGRETRILAVVFSDARADHRPPRLRSSAGSLSATRNRGTGARACPDPAAADEAHEEKAIHDKMETFRAIDSQGGSSWLTSCCSRTSPCSTSTCVLHGGATVRQKALHSNRRLEDHREATSCQAASNTDINDRDDCVQRQAHRHHREDSQDNGRKEKPPSRTDLKKPLAPLRRTTSKYAGPAATGRPLPRPSRPAAAVPIVRRGCSRH